MDSVDVHALGGDAVETSDLAADKPEDAAEAEDDVPVYGGVRGGR